MAAFAGERSTPALLPPGIVATPGPINSILIERNSKWLAIYSGSPSNQLAPELLLLTEARRDVTSDAHAFALKGTRIIAPEKEADRLEHPQRFWAELREKRFHDYAQQSTRQPTESTPVSRAVKEGDTIEWRNLTLRVIDTPGYTPGAITYIAELAGKKVMFTGDLIHDDGKLQDLFSLQDAIREAKVGGYHGWAGRLGELITSLDKVAAEKPDLLIPLRGPVITDPAASIEKLKARIRAVYANYLSIDALRWYFKDEHILAKAKRVLQPGPLRLSESQTPEPFSLNSPLAVMPLAETLPLPPEILRISNSRLILAADRSGFLIDCGGTDIIEQLRKLRQQGKLTTIGHVFVTHYHDDHTDALPSLVAEFGAKVHACGSLVDVLERPGDYRLPCLTKHPTPVTAPHLHGEKWRWKEYQLTIFDFPGQTLHHNALLVEQNKGWCALFAGDSFTPSGIDDYCLQNRNLLHENQGFLRCLDQVEKLPATCMILNQHVDPAFRFSSGQISYMKETLRKRIPLLKELLPFENPNFGLDESWAMIHPYWTTVRAGDMAKIEMRITNHSDKDETFRAVLHAPEHTEIAGVGPVHAAAHAPGTIRLTLHVAADANPGLHIVVADLSWGAEQLQAWTEAVIEVTP